MVSSILLLLFFLAQAYPEPRADPAQLLILKLEESDGDDVNIQLIPDHEKDLGLPTAGSSNDHQVVEITKEASEFNELDANPRALTILDMINQQEPDADGRKCVNKTMMRRETEYDEVLRCDHSYDERCHTTYVTSFEPHQEEECDEKFRKVCMISNEQKAVTEMVEECTTPLVPDCERENIPDVCRTVYDTVCDTRQVGYEVVEQFPTCTTVDMEKCEDVTIGLITENRCEVWPVQQCSVDNRTVTQSNPRTECRKEPREFCAPGDCPLVEGPRVCANKMKTVVVDSPVEECDMEPKQVCRQTTKLVPQLKPALECVQVPKEVCATSIVNPRTIMIPFIQKWCFKPSTTNTTTTTTNSWPPTITTTTTTTTTTSTTQRCPSGWDGFQGNCYLYVGEKTFDWQSAENHCQSLKAHLASIHSTPENDFVSNLCEGKLCWLGGFSFAWTDHSPMDFTKWYPGEPNNIDGDEHCIEINFGGRGTWNDESCGVTRGVVCKK